MTSRNLPPPSSTFVPALTFPATSLSAPDYPASCCTSDFPESSLCSSAATGFPESTLAYSRDFEFPSTSLLAIDLNTVADSTAEPFPTSESPSSVLPPNAFHYPLFPSASVSPSTSATLSATESPQPPTHTFHYPSFPPGSVSPSTSATESATETPPPTPPFSKPPSPVPVFRGEFCVDDVFPASSYTPTTAAVAELAFPSTSSVFPPVPVFVSGPQARAVMSAPLSPGPADSQRSNSQSSPSHVLSPCGDMEYTLADLDAIYRDHDSIQLPQIDDVQQNLGNIDDILRPAQILTNNLFDFGDIKEDMPDFQCSFLENIPDEELEDPDSTSPGQLVIDQKIPTPQDTEPEENSD